MASEMVERLAKKWYSEDGYPECLGAHDEVRWFLNAIADEMDAESDKGLPDSYELFRSVRWLRAQAGKE